MPGAAPLALDFEAHSRRSMPASPGAALQALVLSLHQRARVLLTALSVLNRLGLAGLYGLLMLVGVLYISKVAERKEVPF